MGRVWPRLDERCWDWLRETGGEDGFEEVEVIPGGATEEAGADDDHVATGDDVEALVAGSGGGVDVGGHPAG